MPDSLCTEEPGLACPSHAPAQAPCSGRGHSSSQPSVLSRQVLSLGLPRPLQGPPIAAQYLLRARVPCCEFPLQTGPFRAQGGRVSLADAPLCSLCPRLLLSALPKAEHLGEEKPRGHPALLTVFL